MENILSVLLVMMESCRHGLDDGGREVLAVLTTAIPHIPTWRRNA
jgi:hypothetical protein